MADKAAYTAASSVPVKACFNPGVAALRPVHVQWLPTNRCNLRCDFCSCSERNRSQEMPISEACGIIATLAEYGCRAVTITGGGEPLMHPQIGEMIAAFHENGIQVGLTTNGLLLDKLTPMDLSAATWCRISNGDQRRLTDKYRDILEGAVDRGPMVNWAFSHVVSRKPNLDEIKAVVEFANDHEFTHVRLVADILDADHVNFDSIKKALHGLDDRVIYQPRNKHTQSAECLIGYIKPLIAPDFKMYLCCGVQYALEPASKDLPEELSMGDARNLSAVYDGIQKPFKVKCVRCFYENYNAILRPLVHGIEHKDFI